MIVSKVKLFGVFSEFSDKHEIVLSFPEDTTIAQLKKSISMKIKQGHEALEFLTLLSAARLGDHRCVFDDEYILGHSDRELALMPPISGI